MEDIDILIEATQDLADSVKALASAVRVLQQTADYWNMDKLPSVMPQIH